jgi:hypothetical protein
MSATAITRTLKITNDNFTLELKAVVYIRKMLL